jgi:hypothetical protein
MTVPTMAAETACSSIGLDDGSDGIIDDFGEGGFLGFGLDIDEGAEDDIEFGFEDGSSLGAELGIEDSCRDGIGIGLLFLLLLSHLLNRSVLVVNGKWLVDWFG